MCLLRNIFSLSYYPCTCPRVYSSIPVVYTPGTLYDTVHTLVVPGTCTVRFHSSILQYSEYSSIRSSVVKRVLTSDIYLVVQSSWQIIFATMLTMTRNPHLLLLLIVTLLFLAPSSLAETLTGKIVSCSG